MDDDATSEELIENHIGLMALSHSGSVGFEQASRRFAELFDSLVPDDGPAATVQGEVLRSIDRLRAEDFRNGCINWCDFYESMVHFLQGHLASAGCFDSSAQRRIRSDLKAVMRNGRRGSEMTTAKAMQRVFGRLIEDGVTFVESSSQTTPLPELGVRPRPWWRFW